MAKKLPTFFFESQAWKRGYEVIIGVDEVGRGSLAGPVVAGAVALLSVDSTISSRARPLWLRSGGAAYPCAAKNRPRHRSLNWLDLGIDDSKRLTAKKREELDKFIRKNAVWGIGEVGVAFINRHGIVKATEKAMRQAVKHVARSTLQELRATSRTLRACVLVDAFQVKYVPGVGLKNQKAIVKGDQKVLSIAAASIIAKVYRDRLMRGLARKRRGYGWHTNMGYGTREHLMAIKKYGVTRYHRKAFVNWELKTESR